MYVQYFVIFNLHTLKYVLTRNVCKKNRAKSCNFNPKKLVSCENN